MNKRITSILPVAGKIIFFFSLTFLVFLTVLILSRERDTRDKMYPNVYIDEVHVGGMKIEQVRDNFNKRNAELADVTVHMTYRDTVATFSAEMLELHYNVDGVLTQAAAIGRTGTFLTRMRQKVGSLLGFERFSFSSQVLYDREPFSEHLRDLQDTYGRPAQDALFKVENNKVSAFKIEKKGLHIDIDATVESIETEIKNLKNDPAPLLTVSVIDGELEPEITLSSINNFGIVEQIGEGVSNYAGSAPERVHNVIVAANKLNGILVPKGETFSFNKAIGEISARTGFGPGYIIKDGRTVLGDGGGVCQDSTTLFRAIINAGLPIVERRSHAYRVKYYENDSKPGFDATVFAPSVDLKFMNDTPAAILIQAEVDRAKTLLTFELYGKSDGRQVTISDATVWDIKPAPEPLYQDDPTLPVGQVKQVDWAALGAKAKFHYAVKRDGETLIDEEFYSTYRPWQAVYLVGTAQ